MASALPNPGIQIAEILHKRLEKMLGEPVQVILYGSYARGEACADSDIDLLVVLNDLNKHTLDAVLEIAWQTGYEAGKVISIIPALPGEMETLSASPFFQAVKREGIPT